MIDSAGKKFIRKDKDILKEKEIFRNRGTKTVAGNSIRETMIRDFDLAAQSEGKFRFEYSFIALEHNIILQLATESYAKDNLSVVLINPRKLSDIEMFCSALIARNGMSKPAI